MANQSMMNRIKENKRIFKIWASIAAVVWLISTILIFVVKRNTPEKQNIKTYWVSVIVLCFSIYSIFNAIKVTKEPGETKKFTTKGDLRGRHSIYIDLLGVSLAVMFIGVWWDKASLVFLVIPGYLLYYVVEKTLQWLRYQ